MHASRTGAVRSRNYRIPPRDRTRRRPPQALPLATPPRLGVPDWPAEPNAGGANQRAVRSRVRTEPVRSPPCSSTCRNARIPLPPGLVLARFGETRRAPGRLVRADHIPPAAGGQAIPHLHVADHDQPQQGRAPGTGHQHRPGGNARAGHLDPEHDGPVAHEYGSGGGTAVHGSRVCRRPHSLPRHRSQEIPGTRTAATPHSDSTTRSRCVSNTNAIKDQLDVAHAHQEDPPACAISAALASFACCCIARPCLHSRRRSPPAPRHRPHPST